MSDAATSATSGARNLCGGPGQGLQDMTRSHEHSPRPVGSRANDGYGWLEDWDAILDYDIPDDGNCAFCWRDGSQSTCAYGCFLGHLADFHRISLPFPDWRQVMSVVNIIGISMTVIAVAVYVGYKFGKIK